MSSMLPDLTGRLYVLTAIIHSDQTADSDTKNKRPDSGGKRGHFKLGRRYFLSFTLV